MDRPAAPTVLPCGDRALLVELPEGADVGALTAALEAAPLTGQEELVPAARTVLVRLDREPTPADAAALQRLRAGARTDGRSGRQLVLDVAFDGPDLAEVAELTGRAVDELVDVLTATELTVAFAGFAPCFG